MKKLLILTAALIICNAYGEAVYWMVDNSLSSVSGCEANGNITTPAIPQKNGYRFIGWKADDKSFISKYVTNNGTSYTPTAGGTYPNTWTTTFSWGTVTGAWRCSTDSGTINASNNVYSTNANPTLSGYGCGTNNSPSCPDKKVSGNNAKMCWCNMTNFAGKPVSSLAWVLRSFGNSASDCAYYCAEYCGSYVKNNSGFRRAVFGLN